MSVAKTRINIANREDESLVTVVVLSHEANAETYKKRHVLHVTQFVIPENATVEDLSSMIWEMVEKEFPNYRGEIECQFLERDMLRASLEIKRLSMDEQLEASDITPAFALRRLGRMFVVLCDPAGCTMKNVAKAIKKSRSDSSTVPFLEDTTNSPLRIATPRSPYTKEDNSSLQEQYSRCSIATGDVTRIKNHADDTIDNFRHVRNLYESYAHILESVIHGQ